MNGAVAVALLLGGFAVGLAVGQRWRTRLVDLIDYLGEAVTTYRRANWMQAGTVDELRGELTRISGEHQLIEPGEVWSFDDETAEGWS